MAANPVKRTILLLAANPASTAALDLQSEYEAIEQSLSRATKQHTFRVVSVAAVTDDGLRRALLDHEPVIVHFSGHGAGRRGLVLEEAGEPLFISGDALAGLLDLCSGHVKCVVLNACYSEVQALSISSVVEYVIGMSRAIRDRAAIKFSTGFYDALASGRSYTEAFRFGCNAISLRGIPESLTPTLIVNNRVQSDAKLVGVNKNTQCKAVNIHEISKAKDPSIQELIAVLDFRADMVLSMIEAVGVQTAAPESVRNMELITPKGRLSRFASMFAQLHEKNKKALTDGEFILSHEITRQIQVLLFEFDAAVAPRVLTLYRTNPWVQIVMTIPFLLASSTTKIRTLWRRIASAAVRHLLLAGYYKVTPRERKPWMHESFRPGPWTHYASEYPGPLPESLKSKPNQAVLMWKQDEDRREKAVEQVREGEESRRKRDADLKLRKAESEKPRALLAALQQTAREKGILKEGDRCPKCGFSYAWDGINCYHCHYNES
jgi:CHAT domain